MFYCSEFVRITLYLLLSDLTHEISLWSIYLEIIFVRAQSEQCDTIQRAQWHRIGNGHNMVLYCGAELICTVTFKCILSDSSRGSVLWPPRQWHVWWRKSEIHRFQSIKKLHADRICSEPLSNNGKLSVADCMCLF